MNTRAGKAAIAAVVVLLVGSQVLAELRPLLNDTDLSLFLPGPPQPALRNLAIIANAPAYVLSSVLFANGALAGLVIVLFRHSTGSRLQTFFGAWAATFLATGVTGVVAALLNPMTWSQSEVPIVASIIMTFVIWGFCLGPAVGLVVSLIVRPHVGAMPAAGAPAMGGGPFGSVPPSPGPNPGGHSGPADGFIGGR